MNKRLFVILVLVLSLFYMVLHPAVPANADFPQSDLDPSTIPPFADGSDYYIEINDNVPSFEVWQRTTFPFVLFSPLDDLGRTGPAYACLGPETLPTDARQPMGDIQPSGWQNTRYDDLVDGGNLFNRSHLIGYLLCGDSGTLENLITGTRNLNAGSMLLVETAVQMYIEQTGHHVLYRVTPFYHGDDLVPFGVQMEAQSMETDEDGISCNLFMYNVQPGVEIDYATGESRRVEQDYAQEDPSGDAASIMKTVPAESPEPVPQTDPVEVTYVLNKSSQRFHYPDCDSVTEMKAKSRQDVDWSREEVIAAGYQPCGSCSP